MEDVALALEPVTSGRLTTMLDSADPPQCVKAQFLLDALSRGEQLITSYDAPIQVARFGNELLMIALSGEPVVDWSQKIKHAIDGRANLLASRGSAGAAPSRFSLLWVAGYCNDMFGYLPTRRIQQEGGYEGGRANLWSAIPAPFAGDVEDRIMAAVRHLVERVCE
jgi:hypothetical protein